MLPAIDLRAYLAFADDRDTPTNLKASAFHLMLTFVRDPNNLLYSNIFISRGKKKMEEEDIEMAR